jgi:hypothetical protein
VTLLLWARYVVLAAMAGAAGLLCWLHWNERA